jgi:hypothetical protein
MQYDWLGVAQNEILFGLKKNSSKNDITGMIKGKSKFCWSSCGRDQMVVGFTTTCTISAYHH